MAVQSTNTQKNSCLSMSYQTSLKSTLDSYKNPCKAKIPLRDTNTNTYNLATEATFCCTAQGNLSRKSLNGMPQVARSKNHNQILYSRSIKITITNNNNARYSEALI